MKEIAVTILVAIIGSQAFLEIIKAVINAIKERTRKPTAIENAVKWLLQDRLERIMSRDILAGETSKSTRNQVHKGYKIYHQLKGNGDMAAMLKDYDQLKVVY